MLRASSLGLSLAVSSKIRASLPCHLLQKDRSRPVVLFCRVTSSLAPHELEGVDEKVRGAKSSSVSSKRRGPSSGEMSGKFPVTDTSTDSIDESVCLETAVECIPEASKKIDTVTRKRYIGGHGKDRNAHQMKGSSFKDQATIRRKQEEATKRRKQDEVRQKRESSVYRKDHGLVKEVQVRWEPIRRHLAKLDAACQVDGVSYYQSGKPTGANPNSQTLMSTRIISLLRKIGFSKGVDDVWDAYVELTHLQTKHPLVREYYPQPPLAHLHRLCRLLSRSLPKSQVQFSRLLDVLTRLWDLGGKIQLEEWNALIDMVGRGWRTTTDEDFSRSLSIFNDMVLGRRPGFKLTGDIFPEEYDERREPTQPDIYTYTSLLNTAARSGRANNIRKAASLFQSSGLPPNPVTHLTLLGFYSNNGQLSGVRATIIKMKQQGFELGLDGLNSCIWGYATSNRHDVVIDIYRLLRANSFPGTDEEGLLEVARRLEEEEYIAVPANVEPDTITYSTVIQAMAHHGDFSTTINVLADMISIGTNGILDESSFVAFRAIFLGFSKHAEITSKSKEAALLPFSQNPFETDVAPSNWSLENLQEVFHLYLTLPSSVAPTRSMLYWILVGFNKASDHDIELLRKVWLRLEERFQGNPYLYAQPRIRRIKELLFPSGDHG